MNEITADTYMELREAFDWAHSVQKRQAETLYA